MGLWATLLTWIQLQSTQTGSGRRNPLIFWTRIWNKPAGEKKFSPAGLFQISEKNIFFAGRFVPDSGEIYFFGLGKINFFQIPVCSRICDITGLRTKIKISRAVELRSSKFWKFWKATNLLLLPCTTFIGLFGSYLGLIPPQVEGTHFSC